MEVTVDSAKEDNKKDKGLDWIVGKEDEVGVCVVGDDVVADIEEDADLVVTPLVEVCIKHTVKKVLQLIAFLTFLKDEETNCHMIHIFPRKELFQ